MESNLHLIFDFDGTLVDSFQAVIEKFNLFADIYHYRKISSSELSFLKNLTSKEFINYLGIPRDKIPDVILQIRELLREEIPTLPFFLNVPETLAKLHKLKIGLGILTSNSTENVIEWLKYNNLYHLFDFIHVESSYLDKGIALNQILEVYKIDKTQAFYAGDETRDIDAAKACKISSIAVTWGFNSAQILLKQNPDYIMNKPEDLFGLFKVLVNSSLQNTALS
ncbi:HAD hydrolase-like protein [Legionella micdadei]|uniref:Phosphoglycolate phosphatase n=1 Tax=Legionella micdadei TaxID=451 RepID=A0A098GHJ6_LEGMI|nr:HAD hydrolase-like protein [Legionella micdadei]ARG96668.1 hypothetical protein B6N58_02700 [Legionella micdadei]ARG99415.1 hypothetical protein B6V88_02695 [Legionella micdadei]KTD26331.1 HAD-superfamily hydrolase [Legionella micdadei]NSL19093.1 HAD hydrolase-like protein [Legionella micdadei]CEG61958.1 Phosphoglycolate phosphatase [Legionella micdadei]